MKTTDIDALARLLDGDPAAADDTAPELRELASLAHAVESRAVAPRAEFRDALRERLLAEATTPAPPSLLERARHAVDDRVARVRYSARAAAATTAAALTLSSGGVAVAATQSVPGDLFYPVKLAVEDARIELAGDTADRAELLLSATSRRIGEAEKAAEAGRDTDAAAALVRADSSLRAAAGTLLSAYQDSGDRAVLSPLEGLHADSVDRLAALAPRLGDEGGRALVALETSFDRILQRIAALSGECCAEVLGGSEEDAAPSHEVAVEHLLDRVADPVGQLEDEHRVVGGLRAVGLGLDRLAELDEPLRGQRDDAERPERRELPGDREVREPEEPREELRVGDHRVDLLGADDRHGDDRRRCAAPPRRSRRGRSAGACSGPGRACRCP
jgi:hypothetical protein